MLAEVQDLAIRFGRGCGACADPNRAGGQCSRCGSVYGCRNVSFNVAPGEVLGIVGESGSGKSTVLRTLNLDHRPVAGDVRVDGVSVAEIGPVERRRMRTHVVGMVQQSSSPGLDLSISAGGNVASRLFARGEHRYAPARNRARSFIEQVELPDGRIDVPVEQFSGGMRQRVQLAKILASEPRLVLLDEPTTGLDVSVQARVLDLTRRLLRETGSAAIVVSHDLGVIRMLAERTLVMSAGRVVEAGLTDQILNDPGHAYTQLLVSAQL